MITKVSNAVSTQEAKSVAVAHRRAAPEVVSQAPVMSAARFAVSPSEVTAAPGANPFAGVAAMTVATDAVPELRLADGSTASSEACEPTVGALALIAELESRLAARGVWTASSVRAGLTHVTEDAQQERVARLGVERDATAELARTLTHLSAKAATVGGDLMMAQEWHAQVGRYCTGGDVNGFVQQVLREAYLMGNVDLQMYADRVKSMNELKKKIREEADRARKLKTAWASAAKADPNWVSPNPYQPVRVDSAQMALLPDTESAVEGEGAAPAGASAGGSASAGDPFFADAHALSQSQQSDLAFLTRYDADDLRKKLSTIEDALPSMNARDVETFLVPLLAKLRDGGHTGAIVELIEHMTPKQALLVAVDGFCPPGPGGPGLTGFEGNEFARIVKVQRDATFTLFGDAVGSDKLGQAVTQTEANALIAELHVQSDAAAAAKGAGAPPAASGAVAGDPKTITTVAGMDDYLHYLEDQMNSIGDDAQLANVDLQNCLQKQQQTLQLMSNIAKMSHEIAMAIIRNMNG